VLAVLRDGKVLMTAINVSSILGNVLHSFALVVL
jgi:hypothetical protein